LLILTLIGASNSYSLIDKLSTLCVSLSCMIQSYSKRLPVIGSFSGWLIIYTLPVKSLDKTWGKPALNVVSGHT